MQKGVFKVEISNIFPQIKKDIKDYLTEEEGNISRSKILTIGSLIVMMSVLLMDEVFAGHSSHSSHSSHGSHSSHVSHASHYSDGHVSHASHESHVSHESHTSHSSSTYDYDYDNTYDSNSIVDDSQPYLPEIDYQELYNLPTPQTPPATPIINE